MRFRFGAAGYGAGYREMSDSRLSKMIKLLWHQAFESLESISSNLVCGRLLPLLKLIYFSMAAIYFGWSSHFIIINKIIILIIVIKVNFIAIIILAGHIYQRRGRLSKITKISPDFDKRGCRLFELATLLELHSHLTHFFLISKCPHSYWAIFYKKKLFTALQTLTAVTTC